MMNEFETIMKSSYQKSLTKWCVQIEYKIKKANKWKTWCDDDGKENKKKKKNIVLSLCDRKLFAIL